MVRVLTEVSYRGPALLSMYFQMRNLHKYRKAQFLRKWQTKRNTNGKIIKIKIRLRRTRRTPVWSVSISKSTTYQLRIELDNSRQ
jgi:hypothetical protein